MKRGFQLESFGDQKKLQMPDMSYQEDKQQRERCHCQSYIYFILLGDGRSDHPHERP